MLAFALVAFALPLFWQGRAQSRNEAPKPTCGIAAGAPGACLEALKSRYRRPADIPFPDENPFTDAKAALGQMLFFDPMLSGSGSRACSTCHNPGLSWGDGLARAVGEGGPMALRSPTLFNLAWLSTFGWDGKFPDIDVVTFAAITGKGNMDLDEATAIKRVAANPGYVEAFSAAFGDGSVTRDRIEAAIATYQRTLVSGRAPLDEWVDGNESALNDAAKRGFDVFNGKANCAACHSGWSFTDGSFHDIGSAEGDDVGRGRLFPRSVKLRYAFKVPTLRDVAHRAPFMHNGALASLTEVIELYDRGGIDRPSRSPEIRPLHLSSNEKADLVAFLATLSEVPRPVLVPVLPR